jgi:hypothetical protein
MTENAVPLKGSEKLSRCEFKNPEITGWKPVRVGAARLSPVILKRN